MGCRLIQASGGLLQLEAALMRQDNAQDPLKRAIEAVDAARKRYRENNKLS